MVKRGSIRELKSPRRYALGFTTATDDTMLTLKQSLSSMPQESELSLSTKFHTLHPKLTLFQPTLYFSGKHHEATLRQTHQHLQHLARLPDSQFQKAILNSKLQTLSQAFQSIIEVSPSNEPEPSRSYKYKPQRPKLLPDTSPLFDQYRAKQREDLNRYQRTRRTQ